MRIKEKSLAKATPHGLEDEQCVVSGFLEPLPPISLRARAPREALVNHTATPEFDRDPILLTKLEAASYLRIGLTKLNELLATGDIRCVRIGRVVRIPVRALQDYVQRLELEQNDAA